MITIKTFGYALITCVLLINMGKLNAQIFVTKGSTHQYSVTPVPATAIYKYNWSVTGGTSSVFGSTATSNDIIWDGAAGIYTITVFPEKLVSDCIGSNQILSVTIVEMNISWTETYSTQCPKTDNESGDFSISANYKGIAGTWSYTYNIDGGTNKKVEITTGNTSPIIIPGFANSSSTQAATHLIRITSVTTPDHYTETFTGTESDAALRSYSVSVEPMPATTEIIQL